MSTRSARRIGITRRSLLRGGVVGIALTPLLAGCDPLASASLTSVPTSLPTVGAAATSVLVQATPSATATPPPPTPTRTPVPTATPLPTATPIFSTAARLHGDQTLRIGMVDEPITLDPTLVDDATSVAAVDQLFMRMMRFKPDLTVEPDLAESYSVSPDGKIYTFRLRDWKWSDGKSGSARDFVYALQRQADPRTAAPLTVYVEAIKGGSALVGALGTVDRPKQASDADLQKLRDALGVKALDDRTLQIELVGPTPYFLTMLPLTNLSPLRQDVVEKGGDSWTQPGSLISNGPFVLESRVPRQKLTLKRNPQYGAKAPTLARVELSFVSESAALSAYSQGQLDVVASVGAADRASVKADQSLLAELALSQRPVTCYVGFAHKRKPFDNARVRQAFQLGVDVASLCEQTLGGAAKPARSFIPPGMPGNQPDLGLGYDSARAAKLLADAGYPSGQGFPKMTLVYGATATNKAVAERVQADLKTTLGLDIGIEGWSPATYLDRVAAEGPSLFLLRWAGDYPHPDAWLRTAFHSAAAANYGKWSNAPFDRFVEQAEVEQSPARALDLYSQAQTVLVGEAAGLWLYHPAQLRLVKPWVKGLVSTPVDPAPGSTFWDHVQIEAH